MIEQFVALDIEATGMSPGRDDIIEVAAVLFTLDGQQEEFSSLVNPRRRVSLDIQSLTGITSEELADAPSFGELAPRLRRLLGNHPIVGHSIEMDIDMLAAAGMELSNSRYDTFDLATLLLPDLPNYSLSAVADALGVAQPSLHRAKTDAALTADVFNALVERITTFDDPTLERLTAYAIAAGWPFAELLTKVRQRQPSGPLFQAPADEMRGAHELAFLTNRDRPEPLKRTGSKKAVSPDRVKRTLSDKGPLKQIVPGYERRAPQEQMALAVAKAFNEDEQLLVEAGTGTGKSVAYLVPALLHAVERGERVVVSTNTLALQDQLNRKDVPDLQEALADDAGEPSFRAAILKGRANYLCLRRWFMHQRQPVIDAEDAQMRAKVMLWLTDTETGDRGELRLSPREELHFRHVSADGEACSPARCPFQQRNQCFLFRARREAENAHLVIVNHALLLSDLAEGSRVLPDYEHLIIDEAHHLEDQATKQFGFSLTESAIADHLDSILHFDGPNLSGSLVIATTMLGRFVRDEKERATAAEAITRLRAATNEINAAKLAAAETFSRLGEVIRLRSDGRGGYDRTLRVTRTVRADSAWLEIELQWEELDRRLRAIEEQVRWYGERIEAIPLPDDDLEQLTEQEDVVIELGLGLRGIFDQRAKLQEMLSAPAGDMVYWIERAQQTDRISVHAAPLHVGQMLNERLFEPLRSTVLTSATLSIDGSFNFIRERLGLEDARALSVPSPFDYERSTLLFLADDIPEPNAPGYQHRLQSTLIDFCAAMGGRTLVLFTSHAALQATHRAIRGPLEDQGVIVLGQRIDGNPRQLIERLRQTPNVVVLGTSTFWEGVDVVGPALSALVITKLPFSVPSDPVFASRSEQFDEPFNQYAVPQAVLRFKQGFGRLIRSSHDRGVCAVLDRRVISKRYGASFVESLPACSVVVGSVVDLPGEATSWLGTEEADPRGPRA
ncbi:MAG TPA: helicase C-terminal domain-containing protein [Thermomicrobiales bacterium]|nr:helicase C-terminal domain-containing protein [Thermomicrobiales bacterium]